MNNRPVYRYSAARNCCGPTAMLNAITHLWRPALVPASVVRAIYRHSLDGRQGAGTSAEATQRIVDEINAIAAARRSTKGFRCTVRRLTGRQVTVAANGRIVRALRSGGCAIVDVCCGSCTHALTLLAVNRRDWTLFDPYLWDRYPRRRGGIEFLGHPGIAHAANLRIKVSYLDKRSAAYYALGPVADREAVILLPR